MMRKMVLLFSALAVFSVGKATLPVSNTTCENAMHMCSDFSHSFSNEARSYVFELWYSFEMTTSFTLPVAVNFDLDGYVLYGPFTDTSVTNCDLLASNIFESDTNNIAAGPGFVTLGNLPSYPPGVYYLQLFSQEFSGTVQGGSGLYDCEPNLPCENCIGSFAPEEGKKYLLSAWVREQNADLDKLSFTYPKISLVFPTSSSTVTVGPFYPSGIIIDGWQRIEEEFTIPTGANAILIQMICQTGNCLFDDIRVLPFDGSMKSYVYDPVTLRLVAELDERNYATFYEYDEEGKLVRIKKETEKGVMTIQESKTSIPKN